VLVEYVPLSLIYDSVIDPKIARSHGYAEALPAPAVEAPAAEDPSAEAPADAPAEAAPGTSEENEVWVDAPEGGQSGDDEISDDDFAMP
jgi:hypothetical protein